DEQSQSLKKYVENGGVLLIDSCGGSKAFADSVKPALTKIFAKELTAVPSGHPIIIGAGEGMADLTKPLLRTYAAMQTRDHPPVLQMLKLGEGAVIYSDIDLTCGWLGTNVWGIIGYEPSYAPNLATNLITWPG